MSTTANSNPVARPNGNVATQNIVASYRVLAFWHTMVGKKVVMAATGVVLIGFVIAHMVGNLKIFSGPDEINAYSRFLREVGRPELAYGQLLWVVRIVLLICVAMHITAAVQLSRMSWAARPVGYNVKRNLETTFAARMMRWGGVLLVVFIIFHLFHLTAGAVGFQPGQFKHLAVYQNVVAAFTLWPVALFYVVAMSALCLHLHHGIWSMLQTLGWSIGCGACVAACPNAAAMLFTSAKVTHLNSLPQGEPQRDQRTLSMVAVMRNELFGSCTNHGECEAVCPKQIPPEFIGKMNRDLIRAVWHRHREPLVMPSIVQQPSIEDSHEHFHEQVDTQLEVDSQKQVHEETHAPTHARV